MKPIYSAAFLPPESRQQLLNVFPAKHGNVQAHHMTIAFKPNEQDISQLPLGQLIELKVTGYAEDEFGQAAAVQPVGVVSQNPVPHITISCNKKPPFYSNELLAKGVQPAIPFSIYAKVGVFCEGGKVAYSTDELDA